MLDPVNTFFHFFSPLLLVYSHKLIVAASPRDTYGSIFQKEENSFYTFILIFLREQAL